jgi:hypothetical protein
MKLPVQRMIADTPGNENSDLKGVFGYSGHCHASVIFVS